MKRIFLFLLLASACFGQSYTSVSATILDANGTPYAGGTFNARLTVTPGTRVTLLNGNILVNPGPAAIPYDVINGIAGQIDNAGQFSVQLMGNANVLPVGTQWNFTICAADTVTCFISAQNITGTTQDLSAVLSSASTIYYDLKGNAIKAGPGGVTYNDTTRQTTAGGGGGGSPVSPGGSNGYLQFNNFGLFGGFPDGSSHQLLHGGQAFGAVDLATEVTGILPIANGGTATATPGLIAGTNVTLSGSWPNQTINAAGGGGGSPGGTNGQIQYNNSSSFGGISTSGTGNVVLNISPSITGLTLPDITGSTQCLQADSSGHVSGSGLGCNTGGAGGTPGVKAMSSYANAQTALNALTAGDTMIVNGTYALCSGTISAANVTLTAGYHGGVLQCGTNNVPTLHISTNGVEVANLTVQHTVSPIAGGVGILVDGGLTGSNIHGNLLQKNWYGADLGDTSNSRFDKNYMQLNNSDGVHGTPNASRPVNQWYLDGNLSQKNLGWGYRWEIPSGFSGVQMTGPWISGWTQSFGNALGGFAFIGSAATASGIGDIWISGAFASQDNGTGFYFDVGPAGGRNIILGNVYIEQNGTYAGTAGFSSATQTPTNAGYGIYFTSSCDATPGPVVTGANIWEASDSGIRTDCAGTTLNGIQAFKNGMAGSANSYQRAGIAIRANNVSVNGAYLRDSGSNMINGVDISNSANKLTVNVNCDATVANCVKQTTTPASLSIITPGSISPGVGGGNVSNSGTPTSGQIPVWQSSTAISGVTNLSLLGDVYANGRPWVDVRVKGCVGDGSTDDTTCITNAITTASNLGTIGGNSYSALLYFPCGNYLVSNPLVLPRGTSTVSNGVVDIKGESKSCVTITASGTFPTNRFIFEWSQSSSVRLLSQTISDLTIVEPAVTGVGGMHYQYTATNSPASTANATNERAERLTLRNIEFRGNNQYNPKHIYLEGDCFNCTIENVYWDDVRASGGAYSGANNVYDTIGIDIDTCYTSSVPSNETCGFIDSRIINVGHIGNRGGYTQLFRGRLNRGRIESAFCNGVKSTHCFEITNSYQFTLSEISTEGLGGQPEILCTNSVQGKWFNLGIGAPNNSGAGIGDGMDFVGCSQNQIWSTSANNAAQNAWFVQQVMTGSTITNAGTGYSSAPTWTTTGGSCTQNGSGRTTLSSTTVASLIIDIGANCQGTPTIVFAGGGGSGAVATATMSGAGTLYMIKLDANSHQNQFYDLHQDGTADLSFSDLTTNSAQWCDQSSSACATYQTLGRQVGIGRLVASGTATLGTSAISSGTCATVVTVAATGVLTSDRVGADFSADPTSTTGYAPSASGTLTIAKYPTANNVNFKVCNNTASSVTPGAATLNWGVVR